MATLNQTKMSLLVLRGVGTTRCAAPPLLTRGWDIHERASLAHIYYQACCAIIFAIAMCAVLLKARPVRSWRAA